MMSRSPAKARITPAEPNQLARSPTAMMLRLSRHAAALCFVCVAVFFAMSAMEFLYFRQLSGGLPSLDLRFTGFTPDEGMAWLTALGRRGSEIILVWHYLTFDLLFPALLSLTLVSLILATGRRLKTFRALSAQFQSLFAFVLVLPYMLADYAQNIAVARLLSDFLSANPDSLSFASALIVIKFALLTIPVIVIAVFHLAGQKQR
ncbi:MAG: hypothetical protein EOR78_04120 [Mesorhizobium sp.]|nr:MAG: hypothetical protein EOR49_09485 [Mesorhizobium sp.]RWM51465.1 MAG: hypothetical protein EOR76_05760 [Mesorhizobium sp.]RWM59621.1 MAG: hypothetical protein EOR78_04120 [Mesorhizobium sp.]RWM60217.1 MAG: hypothetical protein EOR79_07890 [Mesorhizobium sp.]RWN03308.1 MAG: hypothetical protein EOR85_10490 [Mesorhizobium sp.]